MHIFLFWESGWAAAPALCRHCMRLWKDAETKGHTVHALDLASLAAWAPDLHTLRQNGALQELPACLFSGLVRLRLLANHAGLWVDPTVVRLHDNAEEWIADHGRESGFFAFDRSRPWDADANRKARLVVCAWLLYAAEPGHVLITRLLTLLEERVLHPAPHLHSANSANSATSANSANSATAITVHAEDNYIQYHLFHTILLLESDGPAAQTWERTPTVDARLPLSVSFGDTVDTQIRALKEVPVQKLTLVSPFRPACPLRLHDKSGTEWCPTAVRSPGT